jgi:hypothetical protein
LYAFPFLQGPCFNGCTKISALGTQERAYLWNRDEEKLAKYLKVNYKTPCGFLVLSLLQDLGKKEQE